MVLDFWTRGDTSASDLLARNVTAPEPHGVNAEVEQADSDGACGQQVWRHVRIDQRVQVMDVSSMSPTWASYTAHCGFEAHAAAQSRHYCPSGISLGLPQFVLIARRSGKTSAAASVATQEQVLARWYTLIQRLELEPPPPNKGVLWSKISSNIAEIINAKKNGLVTLEMRLEDNSFLELYLREFGSYETTKSKGLDHVAGKIWQLVSKKYARLLEGKVTAYVDNKAVARGTAEEYDKALNAAVEKGVASSRTDAIHHGAGSDAGPVFITELEEIAELMASNSKVTSVNVVDVKTGQTWHMTRQDVFELRLTRRSVLINPVVSDRFGHQRSFKPSQLMECWIVSGLWRK